MFDRTHPGFVDFIRESNRIESILRDPTEGEIAAHERLLGLAQLTPTTVGDFQGVIAPGKPLRERPRTQLRARLEGVKVGFYAGLAGLDRIALSRFLQAQKARIEIVASAEALTDGLRSGRLDAGLSEALMARQIAGTLGVQVAWLPESLGRYPVAFGLWKGDLTLKRRLVAVIDDLEGEGLTRELAQRYRIAPIDTTLRLN